MDNTLPDPKPFSPPTQPAPTSSNPYDTEIPPESIEHTPERPNPLPATNPLMNSPRVEMPAYHSDPPSAEQVRSNDLPHKPHHFVTKKALILGLLFIVTAALSSIVTFALVGSRAQKTPDNTPAPIAKISPTPDPMADWQTFTDILGTYTVEYPKDYQIYNPADSTTLIGAAEQIALYKQVEATPDFTSKPSTLSIAVLPSQIYKPAQGANTELVTLSDKEFSKITTNDVASGITSVEYVYSDSEHLYRLSYIQGDNDSNFEKIISTFRMAGEALASPSNSDSMTACTMDAKVCPDGSSVGRIPPSCEFAACP